jgi:hypothetical protein
MAGDGSQCRQQGDRLERVDARMRLAAGGLDIVEAHADAVGEKDGVELGGLGQLRQLDVVFKFGACRSVLVAPCRDMVAGEQQEGTELDLVRTFGHDRLLQSLRVAVSTATVQK